MLNVVSLKFSTDVATGDNATSAKRGLIFMNRATRDEVRRAVSLLDS